PDRPHARRNTTDAPAGDEREAMSLPVGGPGNMDGEGRTQNRTMRRRSLERTWRTCEGDFRREMRVGGEQTGEKPGTLSGVVPQFSNLLDRARTDLRGLADELKHVMEELEESDHRDGADGSR